MELSMMKDSRNNRVLVIDDARIIWPNFAGEATPYNSPGNRNFSLVIENEKLAEELQNDTNEHGIGWNVKIKAPREDGDTPFMHLPVKVSYKGRPPRIFLISGGNRRELNEDTVACLDHIDIARVDMDIRPYDGDFNGRPFRTAYLQSMEVTQELNRFEQRYAEEEYPEEEVF